MLASIGLGRAWAADPPPDADALSLQSDAPTPVAAAAPTKAFIEGAAGWAAQRNGLGSRTIERLSLDAVDVRRPAAAWQSRLSARVDATNPHDDRIAGPVFSLREAYLGWQDPSARGLIEFGRINLREGPGYGYSPTDFFRDNALRTITTVDPVTLRENRMGSVMLRGSWLWTGGSVSLALSPKLADQRSTQGFNLDLGSTNARNRGLLTLNQRFSDRVNAQALLYKEAGLPGATGASMTALLSDAVVAHAEWTYSREPSLLARAVGQPAPLQGAQRLSTGLTYSTAGRLSLTGEYQYNGFGLDRSQWQTLVAANNVAEVQAYYYQALSRQDNAARQAALVYVTQRDLLLKNLDLTGLAKVNLSDRSRLVWLDLRYHWPRWDLALQVQRNLGGAASEFGVLPFTSSVGLVAVAYL